VKQQLLGKVVIVAALVFLAALLDSLFLPFGGPTAPPIIVGVTTIAAVAFLVLSLLRGS
jgi:hypothetical protein